MRAIATVSLGGRLADKLEAVAAAGFGGVELFEPDVREAEESPRAIAELAARLGLTIVALQPWPDALGAPDFDTFALARLDGQLALMAELGTDRLLMCTSTRKDALTDFATNRAQLAAIAERAHATGVRVGVEALSWGHLSDYRQVWPLIEAVDHPALGIVIDSFHILARGEPLDLLTSLPGERITLVQLADAHPRAERGLLDWSRHGRCFPGEGTLLNEAFLAALQQTGYNGPWSLEIFSDDTSRRPVDEVARAGYRSLDNIDRGANNSG
ncbi:sugar phosphate isomerase/epimerase [Kushneria sinocarnis]|uniref:Sugar phosphate isomerase/epimerase n=1 Tax=Kushneria sinocarnis TaxID=595502 RepID=A0A420WWG7_9GAMM|nr:sugar phosphate isomerase/epimerase family protein [Kushneria sinocarnis]RKR03442.1 sugar phosphate isomerase/epimerase [Kushneria sinocarnis]